MFRLNDAVRRYQAQQQPQPESRRVAASVATLSPRATPETTRVVAGVAAVATSPVEPTNLALLIEQLREEGALLKHQKNALLIRPTHWQQVDRLSPTGKPCCSFCKQTKTVMTMALVGRRDGRNFGYGRQLSYAGPQALKDLFAGGHFATVKAHSDRWQAFVRWCQSEDGRPRLQRCAPDRSTDAARLRRLPAPADPAR